MIQKGNLLESANGAGALFTYLHIADLNDHMLNVLQAENRVLDFHVHQESDEMFYVIEGEMQIEFDYGLTNLKTGDFIVIPKETRHRPICGSLVKVLLIEKKGTLSKDNTGGAYSI